MGIEKIKHLSKNFFDRCFLCNVFSCFVNVISKREKIHKNKKEEHMQNWKTQDFQKVLQHNGYTRARTRGDHIVYSKLGCKPISITSQRLNACIAFRLIRDRNLDVPGKIKNKYIV